MSNLLLQTVLLGLWQTLYMVFIASFIGILGGLGIGIVLLITRPQHLKPCAWFHTLLGIVVNIVRSVPFIIFMIAIIPLTRLLVGTSIGTNAAIVPLALGAIPFYARIAEAAMAEVDHGIIEAATAMGATPWQIICKVLIPEALPTLVKGATLTIISLVGYSAMAGAVGGGGLGELAIQYGYERFDVLIMVETVVLLVLLVQLVQWWGDRVAKSRKLRTVTIVCIILWLTAIINTVILLMPAKKALSVAIVAGPNQQIMQIAQQVAQKDYGITLKVVVFDDYVLPNEAVNSSQVDANIFQHVPYLDSQIQSRGYQLTPIGKTFIYPMGVFSRKIHSLSQLPYGALVAIPNDPSNEGRALLLFAKEGLITLSPKAGIMGTVNDIIKNPDGLKFETLDAAQLPRVFQDVTLVALTNDYMAAAGFKPNQALFHEGPDSPYANVIVVRTQNRNSPLLHTLVAIMHSKPVLDETLVLFPDGAAIPAWSIQS